MKILILKLKFHNKYIFSKVQLREKAIKNTYFDTRLHDIKTLTWRNVEFVMSLVTSFYLPDHCHFLIEICWKRNKTNIIHNRMCAVMVTEFSMLYCFADKTYERTQYAGVSINNESWRVHRQFECPWIKFNLIFIFHLPCFITISDPSLFLLAFLNSYILAVCFLFYYEMQPILCVCVNYTVVSLSECKILRLGLSYLPCLFQKKTCLVYSFNMY
jgi:hypothetical protein